MPDWSGNRQIEIRQLPDWSGRCRNKIRLLPDLSGSHQSKIRRLRDWSGSYQIEIRHLPHWSGDHHIKIRQLIRRVPDWSEKSSEKSSVSGDLRPSPPFPPSTDTAHFQCLSLRINVGKKKTSPPSWQNMLCVFYLLLSLIFTTRSKMYTSKFSSVSRCRETEQPDIL